MSRRLRREATTTRSIVVEGVERLDQMAKTWWSSIGTGDSSCS